jgi:hypothetical protein
MNIGVKRHILKKTGVKTYGQSCPFVQKLTQLGGLHIIGINSLFVLKS